MDVEWRHLAVSRNGKQLLSPCSGYLRPGRLVALMGPSGSGKTTFLNCLRQDIAHEGQVRFAGAPFHQDLRQVIGFVEQDDIVVPQLTVRQSLLFFAEMRFGMGSPLAAERVDALLKQMHLEGVADTKVGSPGDDSERISGGQRKRLCIARELLSDPKLLLCDEPTSGLDSTMADQVVAVMRSLCDSGDVSVMASIHQPSTSIFEKFDDIILVHEGDVLYAGPISQVEAAFTACGPQRSPSQSVSEFVMDCLVHGPDRVEQPLDVAALVAQEQRRAAALSPFGPPAATKREKERYAAPFMRQVALLWGRHMRLVRMEAFTKENAVQNLGLMLLQALLYFQLDQTDENLQWRFGLVTWTLGTWMFFPLFMALGVFASCRETLERELKVGCYSLEAFYTARTWLILPLDFVWPFAYVTVVYWATQMHDTFTAYLQVLALCFVSMSFFQFLGLSVSASGLPMQSAHTCAMLLVCYFFGWSGLFMDLSLVPSWIRWLRFPNIFRYVLQLGLYIVFPDDLDIDVVTSRSDGAVTLSGSEGREELGVDVEAWVCLVVVCAALLLSSLVSYLFMRRELRQAIVGVRGKEAKVSTPELAPQSQQQKLPLEEEETSVVKLDV